MNPPGEELHSVRPARKAPEERLSIKSREWDDESGMIGREAR